MKKYFPQIYDGVEFLSSILTFTQKGNVYELELEYKNKSITAINDFPFLALIKIREELEKQGIKILCNGSRVDVYPSGMALSSLKAYELKMGEPARKLLNIFEPTDNLEKIATINDQKAFWEKWLISPKG